MKFFLQLLRNLRRDFQSGQLHLLFISLVLATAALSSVGFLSQRLNAGMKLHAAQLMGGQMSLVSDKRIPEEFLQQIQDVGLQCIQTVSFATMARTTNLGQNTSTLVTLKAVPPGYPLLGTIELRSNSHTSEQRIEHKDSSAPAPNEAWVDEKLLHKLGIQLGETILLGNAQFTTSHIIAQEPDRGASFLNFAPRIMINSSELDRTELILPGARLTWRLSLTGKDSSLNRFKTWANQRIQTEHIRGLQVEDLDTARPEIRITLERATQFMNLVALLCAMLCAVALALASKNFALHKLNECALMRVFGLTQKQIAQHYLLGFLVMGLLASCIGEALGYLTHLLLIDILKELLPTELPSVSAEPAFYTIALGLTLLMAFGWPPIAQMAKVPAMMVIRQELGKVTTFSKVSMLSGMGGFVILLFSMNSQVQLTAWVLGSFGLASLIFMLISWCFLYFLKLRPLNTHLPIGVKLTLQQLCARPLNTITQISALAMGLLAIFLLILLNTDFIPSWQQSTPLDAPNRIVINIMPEQAEFFQQTLDQAGITQRDWFPMFKGRLTHVNDQAVNAQTFEEPQAKRLIEREFNLSYSGTLPSHNRITKGIWTQNEPHTISIESGLAKTLHLNLGDVLRFEVAGSIQWARITSFRDLNWTSMHVNFFALFPADSLPNNAVTYIAAFKMPMTSPLESSLQNTFPNITSFDLTDTIDQIQAILNQVIQAVETLFVFALLAGMLVLLSVINNSRRERLREHIILRSLGASNPLLRNIQRLELLGLGFIAGSLASVSAWAIGALLAYQIFDFNWTPRASWLVLGSVIGAVLAWLCGAWSLRSVLNQSIIDSMRKTHS